MLSRIGAIVLLAGAAGGAQAASLLHDYELNGDLADGQGGVALTSNGGALTATGLDFPLQGGPSLTSELPAAAYSIELYFSLSGLTGAHGYNKVLSLRGLGADSGADGGLYIHSTEGTQNPFQLDLYRGGVGSVAEAGVYTAGQMAHVVLTRDGAGTVTAYLNGSQAFSYDDGATLSFTPAAAFDFFRDDAQSANSSGVEASPGFVDFIRIYDGALTAAEVSELTLDPPAVPEPESWAMMIGGFGLIGAAARRRRVVAVSA